ncbi:molybdopterin-synthase adenylyltransferase MoeB [Arhodomonas sp. AD133]|uniref:molybdopterin-synthase adenylyltransferase MoeB n=1 Tax=Arhodomonas sp. AD133 TaxID=3415009 RepID=UPI003EBD2FAA
MSALERQLARLRERIPEIDAAEAAARVEQGALLIDVREADELAEGAPEGSRHVPRGQLELRIASVAPDVDTPLVLMCAGGTRSLLAADALQTLGYRRVANLAGGFKVWKDAGLPVRMPPAAAGDDLRQRYARQINLPEVGEAGQARLAEARVLVIGAGGLGSPAALYLAAAGVGTLGMVDDDVVDRSNLQRQVLHAEARVGMPKVYSAQATLRGLNPGLRFVPHAVRLTADNAEQLVSDYDLVLDGSDNFATRYALNDACVPRGIPLLHAAVYRFEGQASVVWPARGGPCYRCLFPEPPPAELAPSCAEAGVLGVLPGLLGMIQATEALKILLDLGEVPLGRLLCVDALRSEYRSLQVFRDPACSVCGKAANAPVEAAP